ncbi:tumor necrosis factor receptor superfamily member 14 isoform X3 [Chlorocebus sabaeus]|uniref:tumor necrosis factor receptor superfamily member 14 isoform X3 n=1 Tax=Chlorocebus sabaeus TaxID=60711 RepID=UPI003BFA2109
MSQPRNKVTAEPPSLMRPTVWLVLYLTFLGSSCYAPALPSCKEDEYPVGSECCPKCGPGFHVRQACGEQTGTVCEPCSPGTYIAHFNGLSKCLQCQMCDPAMGLRTSRNCSTTANALCGCSPGHFCIIQDGDHCAACRAYATSSPGQRVQKGGTESQDTLCQNCPPGTFSSNGTLEECQHGNKCSKWLVTEAGPGTSSSRWVWWLLSGSLIVIVIVGLIILRLIICVKRRKSRGDVVKVIVSVQRKRQEAEGEAIVTEAVQAPPDITTVAVEETEPAFTGRS